MKTLALKIVFPAALGVCLLAGCGAALPPAASSVPLPSAVPESESTATDTAETPAPVDTETEYADLSFLTDEQQALYAAAYDIKDGLYGMGGNLMYQWGYPPVLNERGEPLYLNEDYVLYDADYQGFQDRIHQLFTDNCLAATDYAVKFVDYQGQVAVWSNLESDMVEGTTFQVDEAYPDTYRLVSCADDAVTFMLISHYDRNGWNGDDKPMDIYTIEYPIRMVKTNDGWRLDEFHTTRYGAPALTETSGIPGAEYTDLSFLSKPQQLLYQSAAALSPCFYSLPDNLSYVPAAPPFEPQTDGASVRMDGLYALYENTFDDFTRLISSIYTPAYLRSLGPLYTQKFVERDGHLALCEDSALFRDMPDGVTRTVLDACPDTYRLIAATEDSVVFTLISHYDRSWETTRTADEMDVYTIEYPIRMVRTTSGWRVDEFHTTMYG